MKKTSADYQKKFRSEMRAKGFVKVEGYVPLDLKSTAILMLNSLAKGQKEMTKGKDYLMKTTWTTETLAQELGKIDHNCSVSVIDYSDDVIRVTTPHILAGHEIFVEVNGGQILVQRDVCPLRSAPKTIDNTPILEYLLKINKILPLSTFGIETIGGEDVIILFGSLSPSSTIDNIIEEILVFSQNYLEIVDIFFGNEEIE